MTSTAMTGNAIREALEPFAKAADGLDHYRDSLSLEVFAYTLRRLTVGDLRRARTAYDAIGSGVKAPVDAVLQAIRSWGDGPCDDLEDLERRVLSCLSTHTAAGAGPVSEAAADARDEGWQPIETAPTGGKFGCFLMLAFGPPGDQTVSEGMHFQGRFYAASVFYTGGPHDTRQFTFREHEVKPTHWRHTLAAPGAARPVEEPGEVDRITRDRDFWVVSFQVEVKARIAAEAALAETRKALRYIAEGNLGSEPWQANYERIKDAARVALTGDAQEAGR